MRMIRVLAVLFLAASAGIGGIEIVSTTGCPVEATWNPVRVEAVKVFDDGSLRVSLVRGFPFDTENWEVDIGGDGSLDGSSEVDQLPEIDFSTYIHGETGEVVLMATDLYGNVMWTCPLDGTDEWNNYQMISGLPGGGWLVNSPPDLHSMYTEIHRISPSGELLWHCSLGTEYLLDLDEPIGETYADVTCMTLDADGDALLCGSVRQFYTSPEEWFVCLLDGSSGEPVWSTHGRAEGEARFLDVAAMSDGRILAVGETAESVVQEGMSWTAWGSRMPLVTIFEGDGTLEYLDTPGSAHIHSLQGLMEYDAGMDYVYDSVLPPLDFIVAGVDTTSDELVLVRASVSAE
jgi:hypothetical protein